MAMNEEKDTRTFYVDYIATATILMAVGVAGSAFLASNQVIASIDNMIEEEEEVSAANITTITPTNATNSNATAVITTPIPPTETRPENITTTTEEGEEGEEE